MGSFKGGREAGYSEADFLYVQWEFVCSEGEQEGKGKRVTGRRATEAHRGTVEIGSMDRIE